MQTHHRSFQPEVEDKPPVQPLERKPQKMDKRTFYMALGGVFLILVLAGVGTGYLLASPGKGAGTIGGQTISTDGGKTFGSTDTKTFTDTAVGTIEKDGIDGEGTHKLIREGGPSQTACLVSSVLDLDEFVGKKVKVWSKTEAAKKCPWLMDVGRIELQ
jgi:hypothetical protein